MEIIKWFRNYTNSDELWLRFVVFYGLLGGIVFLGYAISNIFANDYLFVVFEATLAVISFFLVFIIIKTKDTSRAKNLGFIPIFAISISNFTMGGI